MAVLYAPNAYTRLPTTKPPPAPPKQPGAPPERGDVAARARAFIAGLSPEDRILVLRAFRPYHDWAAAYATARRVLNLSDPTAYGGVPAALASLPKMQFENIRQRDLFGKFLKEVGLEDVDHYLEAEPVLVRLFGPASAAARAPDVKVEKDSFRDLVYQAPILSQYERVVDYLSGETGRGITEFLRESGELSQAAKAFLTGDFEKAREHLLRAQAKGEPAPGWSRAIGKGAEAFVRESLQPEMLAATAISGGVAGATAKLPMMARLPARFGAGALLGLGLGATQFEAESPSELASYAVLGGVGDVAGPPAFSAGSTAAKKVLDKAQRRLLRRQAARLLTGAGEALERELVLLSRSERQRETARKIREAAGEAERGLRALPDPDDLDIKGALGFSLKELNRRQHYGRIIGHDEAGNPIFHPLAAGDRSRMVILLDEEREALDTAVRILLEKRTNTERRKAIAEFLGVPRKQVPSRAGDRLTFIVNHILRKSWDSGLRSELIELTPGQIRGYEGFNIVTTIADAALSAAQRSRMELVREYAQTALILEQGRFFRDPDVDVAEVASTWNAWQKLKEQASLIRSSLTRWGIRREDPTERRIEQVTEFVRDVVNAVRAAEPDISNEELAARVNAVLDEYVKLPFPTAEVPFPGLRVTFRLTRTRRDALTPNAPLPAADVVTPERIAVVGFGRNGDPVIEALVQGEKVEPDRLVAIYGPGGHTFRQTHGGGILPRNVKEWWDSVDALERRAEGFAELYDRYFYELEWGRSDVEDQILARRRALEEFLRLRNRALSQAPDRETRAHLDRLFDFLVGEPDDAYKRFGVAFEDPQIDAIFRELSPGLEGLRDALLQARAATNPEVSANLAPAEAAFLRTQKGPAAKAVRALLDVVQTVGIKEPQVSTVIQMINAASRTLMFQAERIFGSLYQFMSEMAYRQTVADMSQPPVMARLRSVVTPDTYLRRQIAEYFTIPDHLTQYFRKVITDGLEQSERGLRKALRRRSVDELYDEFIRRVSHEPAVFFDREIGPRLFPDEKLPTWLREARRLWNLWEDFMSDAIEVASRGKLLQQDRTVARAIRNRMMLDWENGRALPEHLAQIGTTADIIAYAVGRGWHHFSGRQLTQARLYSEIRTAANRFLARALENIGAQHRLPVDVPHFKIRLTGFGELEIVSESELQPYMRNQIRAAVNIHNGGREGGLVEQAIDEVHRSVLSFDLNILRVQGPSTLSMLLGLGFKSGFRMLKDVANVLTDAGFYAFLRAHADELAFYYSHGAPFSLEGYTGRFLRRGLLERTELPLLSQIGWGMTFLNNIQFRRAMMVLNMYAIRENLFWANVLHRLPAYGAKNLHRLFGEALDDLYTITRGPRLAETLSRAQIRQVIRTQINRAGMLNLDEQGIGQNSQFWQRIMMLVPSFTRARLGLWAQAGFNWHSAEGWWARMAITREFAFAALVGYLFSFLLGTADRFNWNNPGKSDWLAVQLPDGKYVPLVVSPSIARFILRSTAAILPIDLRDLPDGRFEVRSPDWRQLRFALDQFARGRLSVPAEVTTMFVTDRDFLGRRYDSLEAQISDAVTSVLPIFAQNMIEFAREQVRRGDRGFADIVKDTAYRAPVTFAGYDIIEPRALDELNRRAREWSIQPENRDIAGVGVSDQPRDFFDLPRPAREKFLAEDPKAQEWFERWKDEAWRRASDQDRAVESAYQASNELIEKGRRGGWTFIAGGNAYTLDEAWEAYQAGVLSGDDFRQIIHELHQRIAQVVEDRDFDLAEAGYDAGKVREKALKRLETGDPESLGVLTELLRSELSQITIEDPKYVKVRMETGIDGREIPVKVIDWEAYRRDLEAVRARYPRAVVEYYEQFYRTEPLSAPERYYRETTEQWRQIIETIPRYRGLTVDQSLAVDRYRRAILDISAQLRAQAGIPSQLGLSIPTTLSAILAHDRLVREGRIRTPADEEAFTVAFLILRKPVLRLYLLNPDYLGALMSNPEVLRLYPYLLGHIPDWLKGYLPPDLQPLWAFERRELGGLGEEE